MKKAMIIMLIGVGILFGGIFGYHMFAAYMMKQYFASNHEPVITISAAQVNYSDWQPKIKASGSLRAVKGVNITTELAGMVQKILFTPGADVKEGELLVQLNADSDIAQLHALQASAELAKTVYNRDKAQYAIKAISKATLDTDAANFKNTQAQAEAQAAVVQKKTIRAPFSGRIGISAINPGQYLNPGDKVVSLQSLDPIYVDFYVPQQALMRLQTGQTVTLASDTFPGQIFTGEITTIDSAIDTKTRNVEVEATIANSELKLTPGMFGAVEVDTGKAQRYLTVPQTAISFNPYGDIIYIVKESGKDEKGKPILKAHQTFVTLGETRGDQVAILTGLKEGDMVVISGQIKLKNGSQVAINNDITPSNSPTPQVSNDH